MAFGAVNSVPACATCPVHAVADSCQTHMQWTDVKSWGKHLTSPHAPLTFIIVLMLCLIAPAPTRARMEEESVCRRNLVAAV
jgi:hypothetical protein